MIFKQIHLILDMTLTSCITPDQSGPGSNGNE